MYKCHLGENFAVFSINDKRVQKDLQTKTPIMVFRGYIYSASAYRRITYERQYLRLKKPVPFSCLGDILITVPL